jgi:NhaA family Na+:H+ antiporter
VVARVVGKVVGIVGVSFVVTRATRAELPEGVSWSALVGGALAASMAFTVSLYVIDSVLRGGSAVADAAKVGVLASLGVGGGLAYTVLRAACPRPMATS